MKMLKCPGCGQNKAVPREQATCSPQCSHRVQKRRDPAAYLERMRKAGRARGATGPARSIEFWAKRCPGVPRETVKTIFEAAYSSAYRRGERTGFQKGYDAARSGLRVEKTA